MICLPQLPPLFLDLVFYYSFPYYLHSSHAGLLVDLQTNQKCLHPKAFHICCSLKRECSSPDICMATSLIFFSSLFIYSLLSQASLSTLSIFHLLSRIPIPISYFILFHSTYDFLTYHTSYVLYCLFLPQLECKCCETMVPILLATSSSVLTIVPGTQ